MALTAAVGALVSAPLRCSGGVVCEADVFEVVTLVRELVLADLARRILVVI